MKLLRQTMTFPLHVFFLFELIFFLFLLVIVTFGWMLDMLLGGKRNTKGIAWKKEKPFLAPLKNGNTVYVRVCVFLDEWTEVIVMILFYAFLSLWGDGKTNKNNFPGKIDPYLILKFDVKCFRYSTTYFFISLLVIRQWGIWHYAVKHEGKFCFIEFFFAFFWAATRFFLFHKFHLYSIELEVENSILPFCCVEL